MGKKVIVESPAPDLSIIVSVYNEEDGLAHFFAALMQEMQQLKTYSYEIVCVDDGSMDDSYKILCQYAKKYKNIKVIKFSRNFGKEYGMMEIGRAHV